MSTQTIRKSSADEHKLSTRNQHKQFCSSQNVQVCLLDFLAILNAGPCDSKLESDYLNDYLNTLSKI